MNPPLHAATAAVFRDSGEMGALMASVDWSRTSLGPVEHWPTSLRTMVFVVLRSRVPMSLWWGPRHIQLYNDAFAPLLGDERLQAMGEAGETVWAEIWPVVGPRAQAVLHGRPASASEELRLPLARSSNHREPACFTFSFGPVPDDAGAVGGVLVIAEEARAVVEPATDLVVRILGAQATRGQPGWASAASDGPAATRAERLRLVLDGASLGIWDFDLTTGHLEADARFRALFGLLPDTPLDFAAILRHIHPEDHERVDLATRRMMDPEDPQALAIEYRTIGVDDGVERWVHARGKMFTDPGSGSVRCVGIVRDNAADKALELEREAKVAALARTVRFAELFVGVLGHDLRTPLNTIKLGAEVLAMREDEGRSSPTQRILKSADRMRRMIDDLLDFTHARLGQGLPLSPRDANLLEITQACVDELQPGDPRLLVRSEGDPRGHWDPDRLAQLLTNLLANALEHGDDGAPVHVRIDGRDIERVELEVHNAGIIEPIVLPALFDPFASGRRAHGRRVGLGLGLYITQQIAVGHGGTIVVDSAPEHGTRFVVALPRLALTGST
jgi:signal transduction histidine kinase